jgi:uncharacterized protein
LSTALEAMIFAPLAVILWLANMADRRAEGGRSGAGFAIAAYLLLGLIYITMMSAGILLLFAVATGNSSALETLPLASPVLMGLGLLLPAIAGCFLLAPPVRRLFHRVLAVDPTHTTHAVALSLIVLVPVNLMVNLGVGLENLAKLTGESQSISASSNMVASIWTQEIALAIIACIGVGWLSRRSIPALVQRLGFTIPCKKSVVVALAAGLLAAVAAEAFFAVATILGYQLDEGVKRLNEAIYGPWARTYLGLVTISLAAALGEETLFRGAMQPRFGVWLTSILFALIHSNYGLSVITIVILGIGLMLGLIRRRYSTSASFLAHATYNAAQGIIGLF